MSVSISLSGFFFPAGEIPTDTRSKLKSSARMKRTAGTLSRQAPEASWPKTLKKVSGRIADMLEIDVAQDILVKVWNEGGLFDKYLRPDEYDPEEVIRVNLSEHSVKSSHQPSIELKWNDTVVDQIHFNVEVALDIDGAVLELQDGRIKKLEAGTCTAKGELSCEGLLLMKEKSKPIQLPGEIDFGEGIQIA